MVRALGVLLQIPAALMVLYLDLLSAAALRRTRPPTPIPARARFALLIPAHDEELLLPRLLASIAAIEYPADLREVFVVADNCRDRTAELARAAGAGVYERNDLSQRGKGHALQWLLGHILERAGAHDAYVILDADSIVSANLLSVFNAHLARGDQAIQAYYGVLNRNDAWPAMLRYVALVLYNGVRPRGRAALGLSAGLRGNGMCFSAALLQQAGWQAFTLAEDVEFHLRLVAAGIKVAYAGEATVLAEMPVSLRQARAQNLRWETGRVQMLRVYGPGLLREALARRDVMRLDALAEQLVPPLSVLTGATVLTWVATIVARARAARRLAGLIMVGQVAYVFSGLWLVRATPRAYAALLFAPPYMAWKAGLYLISLGGRRNDAWVRTERRARPGSE